MVHRESGQYCLEPLPDKTVAKGAPPPPETHAEVAGIIKAKCRAGHMLTADGAKAFAKVAKELQARGVTYASVTHKKNPVCEGPSHQGEVTASRAAKACVPDGNFIIQNLQVQGG